MFVAGGMWGTRGHLGSCRHICAQPRQELLKLVLMAREVIWNQKQYVEWLKTRDFSNYVLPDRQMFVLDLDKHIKFSIETLKENLKIPPYT